MKSMTRMFLKTVAMVGIMGLATSAGALSGPSSSDNTGSETVILAQHGGSGYVFKNDEPGSKDTIVNRASGTGTGGTAEKKAKKYKGGKKGSATGGKTDKGTGDTEWGADRGLPAGDSTRGPRGESLGTGIDRGTSGAGTGGTMDLEGVPSAPPSYGNEGGADYRPGDGTTGGGTRGTGTGGDTSAPTPTYDDY